MSLKIAPNGNLAHNWGVLAQSLDKEYGNLVRNHLDYGRLARGISPLG